MVSLRAMSRDVPVTAAMVTQFATLTGYENIDTAVEALLQTSQTEFPVVDKNRRLIGLVGRAEIIRALRELGPPARVSDVMVKDIPTIEQSRRLEEAFRLLQEKSVPAVGVVDSAGPPDRIGHGRNRARNAAGAAGAPDGGAPWAVEPAGGGVRARLFCGSPTSGPR
jgi:predicted transcriptional regulator